MTTEVDTILINKLRSAVDGEVIAPDATGYDEARTVVYGGFDRRPAVVVRPESATGVARVIGIAADTGVELASAAVATASPGTASRGWDRARREGTQQSSGRPRSTDRLGGDRPHRR